MYRAVTSGAAYATRAAWRCASGAGAVLGYNARTASLAASEFTYNCYY